MSTQESSPTDRPSARPKQERSRRTQMRMVEAAYELFRQRGYAVPLTEVAEAAAVSVQNVYFTFQNKRRLAREVLQWAVHGPEVDRPPHEQPWFQQLLAASTASDAVGIWVENTLPVYARVAPLAGMFLAESELAETWDRSEMLRMYGF